MIPTALLEALERTAQALAAGDADVAAAAASEAADVAASLDRAAGSFPMLPLERARELHARCVASAALALDRLAGQLLARAAGSRAARAYGHTSTTTRCGDAEP